VPLDRADLSAQVDSAIAFLGEEQRPNGEFPTFRARDAALVREREFNSTPFATTYVLEALSYVPRPCVRDLTTAALDFLEGEMESHGVWRYWTSRHPLYDFIPPDLDDTCCVSAVLRRFGRPPPSNEELILANRNRKGLFYTWLVPRPTRSLSRPYWSVAMRQLPVTHRRMNFWRLTPAAPWDVDCVVNANVLHYLGDRAAARPVADHLVQALEDGRAGCCDKWYRNACAFYHAVSRAFASGVTALEPMRDPLARRAEEALARIEDLAAAEIALAVCALLNVGHRGAALDTGVTRLAETQRADGAWPAFALWWGGPTRYYGFGSEALTTGLCVEALARFTADPPPARQ
jgi:hypothetical protein